MTPLRRPRTEPATPLDGADAVLADLDGVVYAGPDALPHAVESLRLAAASVPVGYITNNASRSDATVARHLSELGLDVAPEHVVTSPQAAMRLLKEAVAPGASVLVVGGEGIVIELERAGYVPTRSADDAPAAVVQGFAPDVGWTQLAEAAFAIQAAADRGGIPWIATNTDWTIPVARGIAPGNGTLVSAVHTAVGILPQVAGKPETPIFTEAADRFGASAPLMIGDRLDTDILGANRAGIRSVLVLTGVDRAKQVLAATPDMRPDYVLADLRGLHEPYPETTTRRDGTVTVGRAAVRIDGRRVAVVRDGDDPLDLLRAASRAIWASATPIHGLEVPERLYA
ncbi:haloacid dehalogenase [Agromyces rhizosphaerae]|uniref:Haloacid dehalogenase n=1 Tax=Agromyces rhizosphaerae TaxID=88374 RepID=A0A9W6FQK3_9MICO|nr:HAD-IIA family hydrolase [Agromyces rhizosphaerae]GLI29159.1 haloacid dehalogenase [Agromyces rhizosphaerae]